MKNFLTSGRSRAWATCVRFRREWTRGRPAFRLWARRSVVREPVGVGGRITPYTNPYF